MFLFFSFFLVYIPDKNCSNQQLGQEEGEGERERRSPPPPRSVFFGSIYLFTNLSIRITKILFFYTVPFPFKNQIQCKKDILVQKEMEFLVFSRSNLQS